MGFMNWLRGRIEPTPSDDRSGKASHASTNGGEMQRAFESGDYKGCIDVFHRWTREPSADDLRILIPPIQLYMISLQRLGSPADADRIGRAFIVNRAAVAPMTPVLGPLLLTENKLVELTLGDVELADMLPAMDHEKLRSKAYFYAGARQLTLGRAADARRLFESCLAIRAETAERSFVAGEMRRASSTT